MNVLFAIPAAIAASRLLHNQVGARPRLDIPGTLTASSGLFALVYGFSKAETDGWGASITLAFLGAGVVLLVAFVLIQLRSSHPLLPMRVLTDRNRAGSYLAIGIAGAGMFGVFLFLTYFLQQSLGYSPVKTGLAFLPMTIVLSIFAGVAQTRILPKTGARPVVVAGMLLASLGMTFLAQVDVHSTYALDILPGLMIMGAGLGLTMATAMSNATLGVSPADAGVASAMVNTSQQVGGSIGTALLSTLAASSVTSFVDGKQQTQALMADAAVHGYTTAFLVAAGIFAAGAIICGLVLRGGRVELAAGAEPVLAH